MRGAGRSAAVLGESGLAGQVDHGDLTQTRSEAGGSKNETSESNPKNAHAATLDWDAGKTSEVGLDQGKAVPQDGCESPLS